MLKAFPLTANSPVSSWYPIIREIIETNLNNFEKTNTQGLVLILKVFCDEKPDYVDHFISPLVKCMQVRKSFIEKKKKVQVCVL